MALNNQGPMPPRQGGGRMMPPQPMDPPMDEFGLQRPPGRGGPPMPPQQDPAMGGTTWDDVAQRFIPPGQSPPFGSMPGPGYKGGPLPPVPTGEDIPMPVYRDMPPIPAMPAPGGYKGGPLPPSTMPPMRGGGGTMPVPGPDGGPTQIQDWGGGMWRPPVGVGAMPGVAGGWGGAMPIVGAPGGNMMPPSMGRDTLMPLPPGGFPGMPPVLERGGGFFHPPNITPSQDVKDEWKRQDDEDSKLLDEIMKNPPPGIDPAEWGRFLEDKNKAELTGWGPSVPWSQPSMGRDQAPARGLRRMAPKEPVEEVPVETGRDRRRRSRIPPQPPAQKPGAGGKKPKIGGAGGRARG